MHREPRSPGPISEAAIGRLLVLAAAVMWSTSGFFGDAPTFKAAWDESIRGPLLAFWRAAFASVALVPFVRRPQWSPRLIPMVLIFVAMNVTYLSAMAHAGPTNAIWMQNTAPVWVFLFGAMWLGERATARDWLLLVLAVAGVGLILLFELRRHAELAGVTYGVLAGLTYAGVVLTLRQLRHMDAFWLIALNHVVTAAALAPYVLYQQVWPTGSQWWLLAGFGMFQLGLPYVLFAQGVRRIKGHEASGIALLEPVLVPVWVYLAWGAVPAWWTLAGGGLILSGLLLRYGTRPRQLEDRQQPAGE